MELDFRTNLNLNLASHTKKENHKAYLFYEGKEVDQLVSSSWLSLYHVSTLCPWDWKAHAHLANLSFL